MKERNLDFYPHYTENQQSYLLENSLRNAFIFVTLHYSKGMLCEQDCIKFRGHIARQSFLKTTLLIPRYIVRVKKKRKFCYWRMLPASN